jgi:hypothetical protein
MKKHNFNVLRAAFEVLGKVYSKLVITRFTANTPARATKAGRGFYATISVGLSQQWVSQPDSIRTWNQANKGTQ